MFDERVFAPPSDESPSDEDRLLKAIDVIVPLLEQTISLFRKEKKVVLGSIEGGVLSIDELPSGVVVEVNDYDIEGVDEADLEEDAEGRLFSSCQWGS